MTRTLLVDSDIAAFLFASTAQSSYDFGDSGVCKHVDDLEEVTKRVDAWLDALMLRLKGDALVVCLSVPSSECFRLNVLPTYKSNRKDVVRPELLQAVKDHMATNYKSYIRDSLEADDCLGILATHPTLIKGEKVIVSGDKDMETLPCLWFRPAKDSKPRRITQERADYFHMFQTLTGDTVDGYKGCKGIGPVKATAILDRAEGNYWPHVVEAFESKGLTEEDALVQARVARICRADDYDFSNKRVKLWTPTK